jgi:hypothetical protein
LEKFIPGSLSFFKRRFLEDDNNKRGYDKEREDNEKREAERKNKFLENVREHRRETSFGNLDLNLTPEENNIPEDENVFVENILLAWETNDGKRDVNQRKKKMGRLIKTATRAKLSNIFTYISYAYWAGFNVELRKKVRLYDLCDEEIVNNYVRWLKENCAK